jgi:DNA invertase Pin-like site-specific DNA recombinase
LAAQRKAVEDYCATQGWRLEQVFEDPGVSGTTALHERPGMVAALSVAQRSQHVASAAVSGVVVARWDRLARDSAASALNPRVLDRAWRSSQLRRQSPVVRGG